MNSIKIEISFNPGSVAPVEVRFPGCVNRYASVDNAMTDISLAARGAERGEFPFGRPSGRTA